MTRRFSEVEILRILDDAEQRQLTVRDYCDGLGITEQTFYRWRRERKSFCEDPYSEICELKQQVRRLKMLLAEKELKIRALKNINKNR